VTSTSVPARPDAPGMGRRRPELPGGDGPLRNRGGHRHGDLAGRVVRSGRQLPDLGLPRASTRHCSARTSSDTWPAIRAARRFGVNILAGGQDQLCTQFARKGVDRFAGIGFTRSAGGCPVLADTLGYLECEIDDVIDAGDHFITTARVHIMVTGSSPDPLVFYCGRFHRLAHVAAG